jgi:hypothetical protein
VNILKFTLISVKYKLDIKNYLDTLNDFNIIKEIFKMVDFIDGEESEGIKYKIELLKAEDFIRLRNKVNHDIMMDRLSKKIEDRRVLKLIRKYLESGIMINGLKVNSEEGTPQGGPLSPLLANILLDEVDKELEIRGHKFCRYADDLNIYVRSKKAGLRVMSSIRKIIEGRLKLKVNETKSAVELVSKRKFLGFSFYFTKDGVNIRIHEKSYKRFKD